MVLCQMQYLNRQASNNKLFFELGYNNFDRQIEWMGVGAGTKDGWKHHFSRVAVILTLLRFTVTLFALKDLYIFGEEKYSK